MRFVWAVMALVLATLLIGAGVAQRTVLLGPKSEQLTLLVDSPAPFTMIDGEVLRLRGGTQTVLVRGEGDLFLAYGRTDDLRAWLSDSRYNVIDLNDVGEYTVTTVEAPPVSDPLPDTVDPEAEDADAEEPVDPPQSEPPVRNPVGSDLWLDEYRDREAIIAPLHLPEGMSVLIAHDGVANAPQDIVVSWPLDNSTPWVGPMFVGGTLLLGLGVMLWSQAVRFQRRGKGPRRKGSGRLTQTEPIGRVYPSTPLRVLDEGDAPPAIPPAPRTAPVDVPADSADPALPPNDPASQPTTPPTRRSRRQNNRFALPALGVSLVLLSGCTADVWPRLPEPPEASPSATAPPSEDQQTPAVTEVQAARILQRLAAAIAEADQALDVELLRTRMTGTPLAERETDYILRDKLEDRDMPAAIPTDRITILLPQAQLSWPRTVLFLAESAAGDQSAPVIFTIVQDDPWQPYRITHFAEMQPATVLPNLAPAWLGSQLIPPDSPFLSVAPNAIAATFANIVDEGEASEFYSLFDEATHRLVASIFESRQLVVSALAEHGAAETSQVEFEMRTTSNVPIALGTLDSGAIVAVDVIDWERVTPTNELGVIQLNNEEAVTLTGVAEAPRGVETSYSLQLFFSVPSTASSDPIRLLAVHQKLVKVEVIR